MQGLLVDADYVLYMLYKKPWAPGARGASAKLAVCGPYAKNLLPSAPMLLEASMTSQAEGTYRVFRGIFGAHTLV